MGNVILPYVMYSEGAKNLAAETGWTRLRRENSRYKHKAENIVINWGCPERPPHIPADAMVLNKFEAVALASNKLKSFKTFIESNVCCPRSTDKEEEARRWLDDGKTVVARTILNGHGGKGIVLIENHHEFVMAPLYTQYMPKKSEYRVHVVGGVVVDVARKTLKEDHPDKENVNWKVRNYDNGFIFSRFNKNYPDMMGNPKAEIKVCPVEVKHEAKKAVAALGLDFGAVDVIYNQKYGMAFVLEVNTAPGIMETTVEMYAYNLKQLCMLKRVGGAEKFYGREVNPFQAAVLNNLLKDPLGEEDVPDEDDDDDEPFEP